MSETWHSVLFLCRLNAEVVRLWIGRAEFCAQSARTRARDVPKSWSNVSWSSCRRPAPVSLVRVDQVTSIGKKVSTSVERLAVCAKNALGAVGQVQSR